MTRIEELEQSIEESVEKFRLEINKHKAEIEKIKKEVALAELKESKKEKWKPRNGEIYWFRNINGFRDWDTWTGKAEDNFRYNNIPIFPTQPACERYWHFMDTVKEKSYEFSKEEWEDDDIVKWRINYYYNAKDFQIDEHYTYYAIGAFYFKTEEDAKYIIDNFKDELMEYWI